MELLLTEIGKMPTADKEVHFRHQKTVSWEEHSKRSGVMNDQRITCLWKEGVITASNTAARPSEIK
jgi:hypothetical protein